MTFDEKMEWAGKDMERMATELGLPAGFFEKLLHESDWAFVIKLTAFFESVLTLAITRHLLPVADEKVASTISKIEMGSGEAGKISLALKLGLFGEQDARFLRSLCELRNQLAHGIENLQFNFLSYLAKLDENQQRSFVRKFTGANHALSQETFFGENPTGAAILAQPKFFIWTGAIDVTHALDCSMLPQAFQEDVKALRASLWETIHSSAYSAAIDALGNDGGSN